MKIKVLGIMGSPRKKGNTQYLLEQAFKSAEAVSPGNVETEMYSFVGKKFEPCISCFKCLELKDCIRKDDFQDLMKKWMEADVVLYSLPVYHMSVPGQVKCFMDRLGNTVFCTYFAMPNNFKIVGGIVQGAHFSAGQESTMSNIINHSMMMGCIPINGDLPEAYIGGVGWTANGLEKDALEKNYNEGHIDAEVAVKSSQSVARKAVEVAMIMKTGALAVKDNLSEQKAYGPFLQRALDGAK